MAGVKQPPVSHGFGLPPALQLDDVAFWVAGVHKNGFHVVGVGGFYHLTNLPAASGKNCRQGCFHIVHLKGKMGKSRTVYLRGQCVAQAVVREYFKRWVRDVASGQEQMFAGNMGLGQARELVEPRSAQIAGLPQAFAGQGLFVKGNESCRTVSGLACRCRSA